MSALQQKVQELIEELDDDENPCSERRKRAAEVLTKTLEKNNIVSFKHHKEIKSIANDLKKARMRLEDIHLRLQLSIKSGNSSSSIH